MNNVVKNPEISCRVQGVNAVSFCSSDVTVLAAVGASVGVKNYQRAIFNFCLTPHQVTEIIKSRLVNILCIRANLFIVTSDEIKQYLCS
jgi:hypothetical protein